MIVVAPMPAPAVATPAPAADHEPTPAMLTAYPEALEKRLSRQQQYPRLAAVRGWEGEVVRRIVIARKGKLVAVRVLRSSGHEVLDRNAEARVAAFEPYPAPPAGTPDSDLEISVPIRYRLGQNS